MCIQKNHGDAKAIMSIHRDERKESAEIDEIKKRVFYSKFYLKGSKHKGQNLQTSCIFVLPVTIVAFPLVDLGIKTGWVLKFHLEAILLELIPDLQGQHYHLGFR